MARIFQEFLEAVGYDVAGWTESATLGSTINEDEASSNAGSPVSWGTSCLLIDHVTSSNAFTYNIFGATAVTYTAFDVKLKTNGLADGESPLLAAGLDATLAVTCWAAGLVRTAGVTSLRVYVVADGATATDVLLPIAVNDLNRVEVKWDTTADLWAIWVNGIKRAEGALTGAAATTLLGTVLLGDAGNAGAYAAWYDRIEIDNSTHIGPDTQFGKRPAFQTFRPRVRLFNPFPQLHRPGVPAATTVFNQLIGTGIGFGVSTGALTSSRALAGTGVGASAGLGTLTAKRALRGTGVGAGSSTGNLTLRRPVAGTGVGAGTALGNATAKRALVGTGVGADTATGALTAQRALRGTGVGANTAVGALTASRALRGTGVGAASSTGNLTIQLGAPLVGVGVGAGVATGNLTAIVAAPPGGPGTPLGGAGAFSHGTGGRRRPTREPFRVRSLLEREDDREKPVPPVEVPAPVPTPRRRQTAKVPALPGPIPGTLPVAAEAVPEWSLERDIAQSKRGWQDDDEDALVCALALLL